MWRTCIRTSTRAAPARFCRLVAAAENKRRIKRLVDSHLYGVECLTYICAVALA